MVVMMLGWQMVVVHLVLGQIMEIAERCSSASS